MRADKVTAAEKRFETASERIRQVAEPRGGLKVMAISAAADIEERFSHAGYARRIEQLAASIRESTTVTA